MSEQKIVVAIDFSHACEAVLACAAKQSACTKAKAVVVYAVASYLQYATDSIPHEYLYKLMKEQADKAESSMKDLLPRFFPHQNAEYRIVEGYPADVILQVARDEMAEMIVMGSHGHRGIEEALMGSVAEKVIRRAHIPVLVVKACT